MKKHENFVEEFVNLKTQIGKLSAKGLSHLVSWYLLLLAYCEF